MKPVICIGAAIVDDSFHCLNEPLSGTSNPAKHFRSAGGVARNVAHDLAQLGNPVELISHFGRDADGTWLKDVCINAGIGLAHSSSLGRATGHFAGIISPSGELYTGAADAHIENEIAVPFLSQKQSFLKSASLIICDCNLALSCIEWLLDFCRTESVPLVIDPVSVSKSSMLRNLNLDGLLLITPNIMELYAISGGSDRDQMHYLVDRLFERGVQNIWIRKGRDGSEMFSPGGTITVPAPKVKVSDTTGAGDAALAGWIHAWLRNKGAGDCLVYGHAMSEIVLRTQGANAEDLTSSYLETTVAELKKR